MSSPITLPVDITFKKEIFLSQPPSHRVRGAFLESRIHIRVNLKPHIIVLVYAKYVSINPWKQRLLPSLQGP